MGAILSECVSTSLRAAASAILSKSGEKPGKAGIPLPRTMGKIISRHSSIKSFLLSAMAGVRLPAARTALLHSFSSLVTVPIASGHKT
jgi:hypothetical protein